MELVTRLVDDVMNEDRLAPGTRRQAAHAQLIELIPRTGDMASSNPVVPAF